MKQARTKKIFTSLPMIGLILGAVAIATELHRPMPCDQIRSVRVPACTTVVSHHTSRLSHSSLQEPIICAQ